MHFINPPEVQGKLLGCTFTGRKTTMARYQNLSFGSTTKLQKACHCLHLAKIKCMESISEPCLPHNTYNFCEIMSSTFQESKLLPALWDLRRKNRLQTPKTPSGAAEILNSKFWQGQSRSIRDPFDFQQNSLKTGLFGSPTQS
jgi:hypothetical protein